MKLEVGKKYVVRDDDEAIRYVRIDIIREEAELEESQVVGVSFYQNGYISSYACDLTGSYFGERKESRMDLVAEYTPPALNLGPEHVGRRVKLRNGSVFIITGYDATGDFDHADYPILIAEATHTPEGVYDPHEENCPKDIVELLP